MLKDKLFKCKVALLTEIISPYRIPVFNEMAKDERLDFQVIFFSDTVSGRKWQIVKEEMKFTSCVIPGIPIPLPERFGGFPIFFNPGLFLTLCKMKPDVVICGGYHHPSFLLAILYTKLFRKELLLWCESHSLSVRMTQPWAMFYRKMIAQCASAYIVPGRLALDFLHSLGASGKEIYMAPNAVDNDSFYRAALSFRVQKDRLKGERNWPKYLILYVGRLIDSKGIRTLLEAFSKLPNRKKVGLILVGDGAHEKDYRKYCEERSLAGVFFEGFKQQKELPFYYGVADIMAMPSLRDEWGLVLNEAMAAGLPIVASDVAGATHDLIEHGVNGYRFRAGSSDELAYWMDELLKDDVLRDRMGECSLKIIQRFSPRTCADGFLRAIFHAPEEVDQRETAGC